MSSTVRLSSPQAKKWIIKPGLEQGIVDQFPEINPLVLQLLFNREINTQVKIDEFLNPDYGEDIHDPFLFNDMEKAVARIEQARAKKEKVVVHGDYDADGVSGSAILVETLREFGIEPQIYIPHREKEGYGLNKNTVELLSRDQTDLLITVDCGISNKEEVEMAKKEGMDVIVTDHHSPPPELPQALAVINPKVEGEKYPFKELAGAGVAFKLAQALTKKFGLNHGFEKWLLDLVAMGSVADMVPLLGENRTLVRYGLIVLNKTRRIGIQKLIEAARIRQPLDTHSIGFQISPRLNAAGRLDHANTAYELLITKDEEEAEKLAEQLHQTNLERQKLTEKIVNEAKKKIGEATKDDYLLAAAGDNWLLGLAGLVAGKIADAHYKPTLIISRSDHELSGSGRSVEGFDITKALQESNEYLSRFGGHAQACGFTLNSENNLEKFLEKMKLLAKEKLEGQDLAPHLDIDMEIDLKSVDWDLVSNLEKFEPFGEDNRWPRFLTKNLEIIDVDKVGNEGKHLRLKAGHNGEIERKMIGFGFGEWCDKMKRGDKFDAVYEVSVNEWNGNKELQLKIVDLKIAN